LANADVRLLEEQVDLRLLIGRERSSLFELDYLSDGQCRSNDPNQASLGISQDGSTSRLFIRLCC
jgi:hypothetical protein